MKVRSGKGWGLPFSIFTLGCCEVCSHCWYTTQCVTNILLGLLMCFREFQEDTQCPSMYQHVLQAMRQMPPVGAVPGFKLHIFSCYKVLSLQGWAVRNCCVLIRQGTELLKACESHPFLNKKFAGSQVNKTALWCPMVAATSKGTQRKPQHSSKWRVTQPQFKSKHLLINTPEKPFCLSRIWEATLAKHSADTNGEAASALTASERLSHLSPAEVRHGWVCVRGLPHWQGSQLSIKQEVSGLTSQGTGESSQW